ncbi:MAG: glycosyltransferase, partial [Desulfobacterales bacterium]|nr:glycosyltransferase [Desulfobacterales bacterium]
MNVNSNHNSKRRKVAIVVQKYGLVGGGEKFVFELSEHLALDRRWDIHVFANRWRKGSDTIQFHHVPILGFPRFLKPLSFAHYANRRITAAGMDLVHAHERIFNA